MDIDFNEGQEMLKTAARDYLAEKCPISTVRDMILAEEESDYPPGLWREISELGWLGLAFPSEYGGEDGSYLDLVVLLEEMGRVGFPSPFFSTVLLGGLPIFHNGSEEQKKEFLPGICQGKLFVTTALTETSASFSPSGVTLEATADGNDFLLTGTKLFVPDTHLADFLLCVARTEKSANPEHGITMFLVDARSKGIEYYPLKTIDGSKQSEMVFKKVKVPAKNILGVPDKGWEALKPSLEYAVVARCAEMLGTAQAITEMTAQYAKERHQFGQAIGAFQVIQQFCADMLTDVDAMRLLTYEAAWMLSEDIPCSKEVSMAKAWASQAYKRVALYGLKIHGGTGFMEEHDMSLFYKKSQLYEFCLGDADFHLDLIAEKLGI